MRLPLRRVMLLLALAVVALLAPMPEAGRTGRALADLAHAPCFAVLTLLAYSFLSPHCERHRMRLVVFLWLFFVVFSASTELAQMAFGRLASYHDFFANIAGVTAGLLIATAREKPKRTPRWIAAFSLIGLAMTQPALILVDVAIAWHNFPQLASFEQPLELRRWISQSSKLTRVQAYRATDGNWSMQMDLSPARYPGAYIELTERDWSGYDTLAIDIHWPEESIFSAANRRRFAIVIKVEDQAHNGDYHDRFHYKVRLKPGANAIRIPLADIAAAPLYREMDMTRINILQIFTIQLKGQTTLNVDNIRLEREADTTVP